MTTTIHTGQTLARRTRWDDRGAATVQLAVLLPMLFLLFALATQLGILWYARSVCQAAAQAGLQSARTVTGTPAEGQQAAHSFLDRAGTGLLSNTAVNATATTSTVSVEVSATVPRLLPLPGLELRVIRSVTGAKERFTTPSDTGSPR
ncbi:MULTISPECIES: TadE/TadG family type IV pilus assembly protein [unclassified Crossiella]|uniref:TadE/TadG family type IV pilus assembly protein n=1 Tax=unclassified Crossiella TaxID=2620835 RepID=UPI001FFFF325|nr:MULTISPECIES: TadE/TadG family type IV pilus assembly protein [unclassified Crossiella]MCK2243691.1 pilus assembly protein [Crossiella sp. S99.2]MCK2257550.1 pilus assembly protein [Crossiella sp. S99.1]